MIESVEIQVLQRLAHLGGDFCCMKEFQGDASLNRKKVALAYIITLFINKKNVVMTFRGILNLSNVFCGAGFRLLYLELLK